MEPKHFGSQFTPLQFSTTMLTSGWPSARPRRSMWLSIYFKVCFGFSFATRFFSRLRVLHGQMPEPARVAVTKQSGNGVVNRPDERDTINPGQPQRHGRFFLHPVCFRLRLHAQKMHRGAPALLHEAPERLDVVMMNAASAHAQPLA